MPGVSTVEIIARRALDLTCGQECVDWTVDMLLGNFDTPHLRQLAGAIAPYDHVELARLRDRALEELGEDPISRADAPLVLARERLRLALNGKADLVDEVIWLAELALWLDPWPSELTDFELLRWAYQDLQTQDLQWYWPGADRANILAVIKERAEEFVRQHDRAQAPPRREVASPEDPLPPLSSS